MSSFLDILYSLKVGEEYNSSMGSCSSVIIERVPGGWVYLYSTWDERHPVQIAPVFVPFVPREGEE